MDSLGYGEDPTGLFKDMLSHYLYINSIYKVLERLNEEGMTTLLVEQNVKKALSLCKRAYVIENGEIAMKGLSGDILCDENIKCTYLGI